MADWSESLPAAPKRAPEFDDDFRDGLSARRWVAGYLPQWTTPERACARYEIVADGVSLRIDADQPDWRPEDAPLRVSNLQTGVFSGPVGSATGTHRHRADLVVRTETPLRLLFAPTHGRVEITVSASRDAGCMTAAWLVGTEHRGRRHDPAGCLGTPHLDGRVGRRADVDRMPGAPGACLAVSGGGMRDDV
ncbi:hypothetical protein ACQ143_07830 [Microbacterium sp. MC2]